MKNLKVGWSNLVHFLWEEWGCWGYNGYIQGRAAADALENVCEAYLREKRDE